MPAKELRVCNAERHRGEVETVPHVAMCCRLSDSLPVGCQGFRVQEAVSEWIQVVQHISPCDGTWEVSITLTSGGGRITHRAFQLFWMPLGPEASASQVHHDEYICLLCRCVPGSLRLLQGFRTAVWEVPCRTSSSAAGLHLHNKYFLEIV